MKKIEELNPLFDIELLIKREAEIAKLLANKTAKLEHYPMGKLRISMKKGHPEYYFRHQCGNNNGHYLTNPKKSLVVELAQKSYDEKIVSRLREEKKILEKLISFYQKRNPELLFQSFSRQRQKLITPVTLPLDTFMEKWKLSKKSENPYKEKPSFQTTSGVYVRSKSEVMIADTLFKKNIPFIYENPIEIGKRTFYPDFTCIHPISHKIIIWEHFGMMDNQDYANTFAEKINAYEENNYFLGKNMICTFETSKLPLTPQKINNTVNAYFK